MKICNICKINKPEEDFSRHKLTRDGRRGDCKPCDNIRRRKWQYGIEEILDRCQACDSRKNIDVDHCHATGEVRGFLCHGCNVALGMVGDDAERLRKLADYLDKVDKRSKRSDN